MSSSRRVEEVSLTAALAALKAAGARVFCVLPGSKLDLSPDDAVSLAEAARRLDVAEKWVRKHINEFPNRFRLPAGARVTATGEGRNVGEWRIPVADLASFKERQKP